MRSLTPTMREIADGLVARMVGQNLDHLERRRAMAEWMLASKGKFAEMTNGALSDAQIRDVQALIASAVLDELDAAESRTGLQRGKATVRTLRSKRREHQHARQ